jgi:hypothetical protein
MIAYYNQACTLSLIHAGGKSVDTDTIFVLLNKVLQLNPERIEKIKTDSDLDSIRSESAYKKLVNEDEQKEENTSEQAQSDNPELVSMLVNFKSWANVDAEIMPAVYIFTDTHYYKVGGTLEWTLENGKDLIWGEGSYYVTGNDIYLNGKKELTYVGETEFEVCDASGEPEGCKMIPGIYIVKSQHGGKFKGYDNSSLEENKEIHEKLRNLQ